MVVIVRTWRRTQPLFAFGASHVHKCMCGVRKGATRRQAARRRQEAAVDRVTDVCSLQQINCINVRARAPPAQAKNIRLRRNATQHAHLNICGTKK